MPMVGALAGLAAKAKSRTTKGESGQLALLRHQQQLCASSPGRLVRGGFFGLGDEPDPLDPYPTCPSDPPPASSTDCSGIDCGRDFKCPPGTEVRKICWVTPLGKIDGYCECADVFKPSVIGGPGSDLEILGG